MVLCFGWASCSHAPTAEQTNTQPTNATNDTAAPVDAPAPDTTKQKIPTDIVPAHTPLTLIVKNLKSSTAPVVIGVYGPNNKFLDTKDQMKEYRFTPNGTTLNTKINDLKYGKLAMALYQDMNSDGKINKNFVGVPTEPYAFSNDYKPVIRQPKFKECEFTYDASSNTVTVEMGN